jgi:hypothetical protein
MPNEQVNYLQANAGFKDTSERQEIDATIS